MKINNYIYISCLTLLASCGEVLYQKSDYSFYESSKVLDRNSVLKTDGVYVLNKIQTGKDGNITKQPKEHRFYKFYPGGQSNLFLDIENKIKTDQDYADAVSKDSLKKKKTLFEGYYKLRSPRIIIQDIITPRKQFNYHYGYLENNTLVIVKASHEGNGKFYDKNFTSYYKEYYVFKPLRELDHIIPQW